MWATRCAHGITVSQQEVAVSARLRTFACFLGWSSKEAYHRGSRSRAHTVILKYTLGGKGHGIEANDASHALCHIRCRSGIADWRENQLRSVAQSLAL